MIFLPKEIWLKKGLSCVLRSPEKEDAKEALDFLIKVNGESPYLLRYPEEAASYTIEEEEGLLLGQKNAPRTLMLMAFVDENLVAIAQFSSSSLIKTRHRASLAISILKEYWALGLGTVLLNTLYEKAKEIGVKQMELEVVEGNERAQALYEKCGFMPYGFRKNSIQLKEGTLLGETLMMKAL